MSDKKIECTKVRKCGWKGTESQLNKVKNENESKKYNFDIMDRVCPSCGNKEYYLLQDKESKNANN